MTAPAARRGAAGVNSRACSLTHSESFYQMRAMSAVWSVVGVWILSRRSSMSSSKQIKWLSDGAMRRGRKKRYFPLSLLPSPWNKASFRMGVCAHYLSVCCRCRRCVFLFLRAMQYESSTNLFFTSSWCHRVSYVTLDSLVDFPFRHSRCDCMLIYLKI